MSRALDRFKNRFKFGRQLDPEAQYDFEVSSAHI